MNRLGLRLPLIVCAVLWVGLLLPRELPQAPQTGMTLYLPLVSHDPVMEIPILDISGYYGGGDAVRGAIRNTSGWTVFDVIVELTAFDYNNQIIGTYYLEPLLTASMTGQLNPFSEVFPQIIADYYTAEVIAYSFQSEEEYRSATIVNVEVEGPINYQYDVTVTIRNDTQFILTDVTGYIWPRGERAYGNLSLQHIVPSLLPGETAEFSRGFLYVNWFPPRIYTQAQGIVTASQP